MTNLMKHLSALVDISGRCMRWRRARRINKTAARGRCRRVYIACIFLYRHMYAANNQHSSE
jgi:hypothetical protein